MGFSLHFGLGSSSSLLLLKYGKKKKETSDHIIFADCFCTVYLVLGFTSAFGWQNLDKNAP